MGLSDEGRQDAYLWVDTHSNGDIVMAIGTIDIIEGKTSYGVGSAFIQHEPMGVT